MTGTVPPAGAVVRLGGPMTDEVVRGWEAAVDRLWESGTSRATLDLEAVTLLTCSAINALERTSAAAQRLGARLELRCVPRQSARLLHWAHLDHLIATYSGDHAEAAAGEWAALAEPPGDAPTGQSS